MKRIHILGLVMALLVSMPLLAQNYGPPAPPPGGSVIFDPGATPGTTPLPTQYTQYTATFTATMASTDITFAFRHDPGYFGFDDASVTTGGGPNLFTNGGFETGDLTGWSYDNHYGVSYSGYVTTSGGSLGPNSGSYFWYDGATLIS